MGMLVNGIWHQEDPPRAELGMTGQRRQLCAPGLAFPRPRQSRRLVRLQGRGRALHAGHGTLLSMAHRTVLMRKLKALEGTIEILQSDLPKGEGWAYSRGLDDLEPIGGVLPRASGL